MFATSDAVFSVQDLKILQQNTDSDVSDLIETIMHMHAGDDPMSEKEALAGPDAEKRLRSSWHSAVGGMNQNLRNQQARRYIEEKCF